MHDEIAPECWDRSRERDTVVELVTASRHHQVAVLGLLALLVLTASASARSSTGGTAQDPPESARPCASAAEVAAQRILVTATGARRVAGNITFTLYGDRPEAFLAHKGSIALTRVELSSTSASTCFVVSRAGVYAVAVYHDENGNHHFDRSLIGLPIEGYGFSNNASIFMAPPSFNAVRFTALPGDTRIAITLRY